MKMHGMLSITKKWPHSQQHSSTSPLGAKHRFENFSHDFVTWVVFYGPQGGEK
jgi:hypothetical protein